MLSAADTLLARREAALPGLAVLLDPDAMREALSRARAAWSIPYLETSYLRYKPGTSCLAAYRGEGGEVALYATAYRRGAVDKLEKAALVLDQLAVAVHPFPHDRRLRRLGRLRDPESRAREVARLLPDRPDLESASLATLRYKPERRYVASLAPEGAAPAAVIKHYAEGEYPAGRKGTHAFRSVGSLRVARRIGKSSRRKMIVLEWLSGEELSERVPVTTFDLLGEALALLHGQDPTDLAVRAPREERDALVAAAAAIGAVHPESARPARELARSLSRRLDGSSPGDIPIHGDLSSDQVLVRPDGFGLLDLDAAAVGDPSADLGSFLAALETRLLPDAVAGIREALLAGYERQSGYRPKNVTTYTAAGLLRLAVEPFRRREPDWPERTRGILDRAKTVLEGTRWPRLSGRVLSDPAMPFLSEALDRSIAKRRLREALPAEYRSLDIQEIRVARHKAGRRCLIEYDVEVDGAIQTIIGKIRARGVDEKTYRVMRNLWDADVSVPEPLGIVPELRMWLQRRAPGRRATELLAGHGGPALARRIAEALANLHAARVPSYRRHTAQDELAILRERFGRLASQRLEWSARLTRLLDACETLAADLAPASPQGIHRDFYSDHVLVDEDRLHFVDFDLYCEGDPALDAGNFLAHVREQSVRSFGSPDALVEVERAFEDRFVALAGGDVRPRVEIYQALSLARHVSLSWEIRGRREFTETLLDLSEERLIAFRPAMRAGRR